MSSPEEQPSYEEPSCPVGTMQLGLAALFVTPSPKKNDGNGNRFVDDSPFIHERKPLNMTVAKGVSNNDEHTLIPVMAKMLHSALCFGKVCFERRPAASHGLACWCH
jgi:hypothetical protein